MPSFADSALTENVDQYAIIKSNCCSSHKDYGLSGDLTALFLEALNHVHQRATAAVSTSALAGNADDCIEMGLR